MIQVLIYSLNRRDFTLLVGIAGIPVCEAMTFTFAACGSRRYRYPWRHVQAFTPLWKNCKPCWGPERAKVLDLRGKWEKSANLHEFN